MSPAWELYRSRRRAFRLSVVLAPLWFLPEGLARKHFGGFGLGRNVTFILFAVSPALLIIFVNYFRWIFWACPRCKRPFHVSWSYGNPFSDHCIHCDLPLWATEAGGPCRDLP